MSGEELLYSVLQAIVMNTECVDNLELITVQSSHIPELCTTRDCASASHPVIKCTLSRAQFGLH